jgi:hypothetical protein
MKNHSTNPDQAFTKALAAVGVPLAGIAAMKEKEVRDVLTRIKPFQDRGRAHVETLTAVLNDEIGPFKEDMAKYQFTNPQIYPQLDKLEKVEAKISELKMALAQSGRLSWTDIQQIPFRDKVDRGKVDALVRLYRTQLAGIGTVVENARGHMAQIKTMVLRDYEKINRAVAESVPLQSQRESDDVEDVEAAPTPRRRTVAAPSERVADLDHEQD